MSKFTTSLLFGGYFRSQNGDTNADFDGFDDGGPFAATAELAAQKHLDYMYSRNTVITDYFTNNTAEHLSPYHWVNTGTWCKYATDIPIAPGTNWWYTAPCRDNSFMAWDGGNGIFMTQWLPTSGEGTISIEETDVDRLRNFEAIQGWIGFEEIPIPEDYTLYNCLITVPVTANAYLYDNISTFTPFNDSFTTDIAFIINEVPDTLTPIINSSIGSLTLGMPDDPENKFYLYDGQYRIELRDNLQPDGFNLYDISNCYSYYGNNLQLPDSTPATLLYSMNSGDGALDATGTFNLPAAENIFNTSENEEDYGFFFITYLVPFIYDAEAAEFELAWNDDGRWYPDDDPVDPDAPLKYNGGVSTVKVLFGSENERYATVSPSKEGGFLIYETDSEGVPIGPIRVFRRDRTLKAIVPPDLLPYYSPRV